MPEHLEYPTLSLKDGILTKDGIPSLNSAEFNRNHDVEPTATAFSGEEHISFGELLPARQRGGELQKSPRSARS